MNKILINDKRLTPTMERTRSGRTQLFREKNTDDRSFISSENYDVSLEHEKKSMYSELIDGEWYWLEGCAECKGEERDSVTYIECEEHDKCNVCGTSRKDIKEIPWGRSKGWVCKPCADDEDKEIRREAFEKLDGEEPDCSYTSEIICPHCGSDGFEYEHENKDLECHVCKGEISLEVELTPSYTTSIKGDRITN